MTREEAIDILKNGLWWDRKRLDEAIDIAIAALRPISRERVERMKKIMRKNGIMVIPSKYPGGTARWNIQKPRDKKEEL